MKYDITLLTFLPDPLTYQVDANNLFATIPLGIDQEKDLFACLNEQLHFPAYFGKNWDSLDEMLSFWIKLPETQRVVIIHQDLPFFGQTKYGWYWLKIYLKILLKNIAWIQNHSEKELVVIFPLETADTVSSVLTRPPVWEMQFGFREQYVQGIIDVSWPEIVYYLEMLNGLTAEICTIFRDDVGSMTVLYLQKRGEYALEFTTQNPRATWIASVEDNVAFPFGLSFSHMRQVVKEFFVNGQRPTLLLWLALEISADPMKLLEYPSSFNDEKEFIEGSESTIRETIIQGVVAASQEEKHVFSLEYWRTILLNRNRSVLLRTAALCVLGLSHLPDKLAFFFPFLKSPEKKERWVSAVFIGMMGDEQALPTLLNMLVDELPIVVKESWSQQEHWYEDWRPLVPRLLRRWQTEEVFTGLQQALVQWIQAEPFFDPEYGFWREYEAKLCYELGYRGDFATFTGLVIEEDHRHMLMIDAARGYLTASKNLPFYEEYLQQEHFWATYKSARKDLIALLQEKFGTSQSEAEAFLQKYEQDNEYLF